MKIPHENPGTYHQNESIFHGTNQCTCVSPFPYHHQTLLSSAGTQYIVSHWANGSSWTFGHHACISLELLSGVHKGTNKMYLIRVLQSDLVWISGLKWPPTGESKDDFEEAVNIYSIYVYTGTVYKCIFIYYMHEILNKHFPWKRTNWATKKKHPTFQYTWCLIGILIMVYVNHIKLCSTIPYIPWTTEFVSLLNWINKSSNDKLQCCHYCTHRLRLDNSSIEGMVLDCYCWIGITVLAYFCDGTAGCCYIL